MFSVSFKAYRAYYTPKKTSTPVRINTPKWQTAAIEAHILNFHSTNESNENDAENPSDTQNDTDATGGVQSTDGTTNNTLAVSHQDNVNEVGISHPIDGSAVHSVGHTEIGSANPTIVHNILQEQPDLREINTISTRMLRKRTVIQNNQSEKRKKLM